MTTNFGRRLVMLAIVALLAASSAWSAAAQAGREALVISVDGPLTPAFLMYIERSLDLAERRQAELVILQLNTPGGQIDVMEDIVSAIRNSRVPVVVYVAPRGAIAGSAGTVVTLAGHAAAMSPETAIGAASPVGGQGEDLGETIQAKTKEVLKAQVRTLAARRGKEAIALAESTIDNAEAATAREAEEVGLVDFIAEDRDQLLRQLDGFTVEVIGQPTTLATADLLLTEVPMTSVETVLNLLTNPNIVFVLLALGTQAILIELWTPGGWVAGFIGVACLALAIYGLGVLPVNWFGIVFILMAFVLFIMELTTPTHGGLTAAGAGSLVVGALVLFNSPGSPEFFRVSVPLVATTAGLFAVVSLAVLTVALRSIRRPASVGAEALIGQVAEVRTSNAVHVAGELWTAEPEEGALEVGHQVEVVAVRGLRLVVRPIKR